MAADLNARPVEVEAIPDKRGRMDRITTVIKREWLAEIAARKKRVEYRDIKPYWTNRLGRVSVPFELRLINGMNPRAPEVTVKIIRVRRNSRAREFELHIGKILSIKHWDVKRGRPR